jgi:hypothetical protein
MTEFSKLFGHEKDRSPEHQVVTSGSSNRQIKALSSCPREIRVARPRGSHDRGVSFGDNVTLVTSSAGNRTAQMLPE